MELNPNKPRISIGLPVYNGESFLDAKIKSLLGQTFSDYEIIISDNASTDKTSIICKKFAENDERIRYVRQEKNLGAWRNYNFLLKEAKGEYFLWSGVDDIMSPTFLEKVSNILDLNKNISCCISKIQLYGKSKNKEQNVNKSFINRIKKRIEKKFGYLETYSAEGPYEKRVNAYFKNISHNQIFYGMYRTNQIQKCYVKKPFLWNDCATVLNILKFGELNSVDEVLLQIFEEGNSRKGMIGAISQMENFGIGKIIPYWNFTSWCFKNLTKNIFFENLNFFISINCYGIFSLTVDIFRTISRRLKNSPY
jgi:glycosyltransferase involved in cell wall biosynthesis